jgi:tRNA(fMet)-specific endonuclease VapC
MATYMVDTNICIYAIRRSNPALTQHFTAHEGEICVSSVTLAELRFGSERSARRDANLEELRRFLEVVEVCSFDALAAEHFGDIKAQLFRAGTPVGPLDMLIGAHARSLNLTLVTNNRREFDRMPGLTVENWA